MVKSDEEKLIMDSGRGRAYFSYCTPLSPRAYGWYARLALQLCTEGLLTTGIHYRLEKSSNISNLRSANRRGQFFWLVKVTGTGHRAPFALYKWI